jgi:hypothetical protein
VCVWEGPSLALRLLRPSTNTAALGGEPFPQLRRAPDQRRVRRHGPAVRPPAGTWASAAADTQTPRQHAARLRAVEAARICRVLGDDYALPGQARSGRRGARPLEEAEWDVDDDARRGGRRVQDRHARARRTKRASVSSRGSGPSTSTSSSAARRSSRRGTRGRAVRGRRSAARGGAARAPRVESR